MFYFLEVSDACMTVLGLLFFVRELLKIVFIIVPIGLIIMLMVDFFKGVINAKDDSKKILGMVLRRIIYTMALFLIPGVIFGVLNVIGVASQDSESCWTYVNKKSVSEVQKIIKDNEEARKLEKEKEKEALLTKLNEEEEKKATLKGTIISQASGDNLHDGQHNNGVWTNIDWNDLTKTTGMTASELTEKLDALEKRQPVRRFISYTTELIKAENNYNVNVIFLMSLEAHESAWFNSSAAKDCNNLGGVKGEPRCSGHEYRKFNSKGEFIKYHGKLLGENYLSKNGKYYNGTGIEDVKKYYCPESNCSTWVSNIKTIGKGISDKLK